MSSLRDIEARPLHRGHFAFIRAVVQGVDPVTSWSIYLQLEKSRADKRTSQEMAAWIRAKCAAAARRDGRHHVARLLRLDLSAPGEADGANDAAGIGPAAPASSPGGPPRTTPVGPATKARKRADLVRRQLDALRALEVRMLAQMSAKDPVRKWLPAHIAKLLEEASLITLSLLAERINSSIRWWGDVRAVSQVKAARIADWARMHAQDMGIGITPGLAHSQTGPLNRGGPSTALVPLEHFLVPRELDGHDGAFRMPSGECLLDADNDRQAIEAWLNSTLHALHSTHTFRMYRKQAERLLLWCVLVRRKPVSSLTHADAQAYRDFLVDPPDQWCGRRGNRRDLPQWRPMEKGLSGAGLDLAFFSLKSLFRYLITHRYVYGHPFVEPRPRDVTRPDTRLQRTLTFEQWDRIRGDLSAELETGRAREPIRRRARAIRWLYATGLSLSELVAVECGALRQIFFTRTDGESDSGWVVRVVGRQQLTREVSVPSQLIAELGSELARAGRPPAPTARVNARVPVVGRFSSAVGGAPPPWSASGLHKSIKAFMEACASRMNSEDAAQVRQVSAGWLRNSYGVHAVKGRRGDVERKPVPAHHVATNLGSRTPWLIAVHLPSTEAQRHEAMKDYWPPDDAP